VVAPTGQHKGGGAGGRERLRGGVVRLAGSR
jgi:hypothetical protein